MSPDVAKAMSRGEHVLGQQLDLEPDVVGVLDGEEMRDDLEPALGAEVDRAGEVTEAARELGLVAQDCGPVSNPDGMRNQLEGGALQGLSRALGEEVTWDDRKVTSVDWRTYHSLMLGDAMPIIESVLIDRHDVEATGAGETAITVIAAAIGNAVFDATGVRIRQVPFTPARVKAALAAG